MFDGKVYGEHSNAGLGMMFEATIHTPVLQSCEIDGDVAHTESYVIGIMLDKDKGDGAVRTSQVVAGRYIDRLERRDGRWGIMVRRVTVEIVVQGQASIMRPSPSRRSTLSRATATGTTCRISRPLNLQEADRLTP